MLLTILFVLTIIVGAVVLPVEIRAALQGRPDHQRGSKHR
jgi:hypothetical protein